MSWSKVKDSWSQIRTTTNTTNGSAGTPHPSNRTSMSSTSNRISMSGTPRTSVSGTPMRTLSTSSSAVKRVRAPKSAASNSSRPGSLAKSSTRLLTHSLGNEADQELKEAATLARMQKAKDRWKNIGKCIIMVSSVASQFQKLEVTRKEIEKTQNQIKSYLEHRFEVDRRFMFDPSIFKRPKQEIFFSRELDDVGRNIRLRTPSHIRSLRLTLRDCSSFAAYPEYVQTELCRVGLLERYGRGRVILREGHLPSRVYFILSGTVVLTRFNKEIKEEQTLQILNKGDIFGDTEVLEQTMRTATVTTALDAIFWSVDGQDFKNSMTRNLEEVYKTHSCSILGKTLRLTTLSGNSCTINEDGSEHEMSLVTKRHGSLSVPRGHDVFTNTTPRGSIGDASMALAHRGSLAVNYNGIGRSASMTAMTARSAIHNFLSSLQWFDDVPTVKFLEDPKAATLVYFRNNKCIVQSSSNNDLLCFVRGGKCDVITRITIETSVRPPSAVSCFSTGMSYHDQKARRIRPVTGIIRNRNDRISIISRPVSAPCKALAGEEGNTAPSSTRYKQRAASTVSGNTSGKITETINELGKETERRMLGSSVSVSGSSRISVQSGRHVGGRPDTARRSTKDTARLSTKDRARLSTKQSVPPTRQEFLKVCTLEEGDVFGMTSLFAVDDELKTSLVSRGCECVIVKKDTFLLLLNRQTKDNIKEKVLFYPSYLEMKKKLLNLYSWSTYKDNLRVKSGRNNPG